MQVSKAFKAYKLTQHCTVVNCFVIKCNDSFDLPWVCAFTAIYLKVPNIINNFALFLSLNMTNLLRGRSWRLGEAHDTP